MSTRHERRAPARVALLVSVCAGAAAGIRCDYGDYPLEPTFCDRWCRVLSRSNCDQEPENCVRNCERSTAPAACSELYEPLLACYEATPATGFECSGQGFQQIARPDESVCQGQRDALIECAYPEVKACLDLCRAFDALYGGDAGGEPGSDTDAGMGVICPSRDIPCDSICWIVQGQSAEGIEPDDELDAGSSISLDAGSDISTLADELFVCAIDKAEACRSGAAQPAPDGGQPVMSANWTSVLFACADELGF